MALKAGDSYFSFRRDDVTSSGYNEWTVPLDLLPTRYAPVEKQLRVFVNQTEYAFDDETDPGLATEKWTSLGEETVTGAPCWGVRFTFSRGSGFSVSIREFGIWTNGIFRTAEELGLTADDSYDGDMSTSQNFSVTPATKTFTFSQQQFVTKAGWSRPSGSNRAENMTVQINVGTPDDPDWVTIGSRTGLSLGDYPASTDPYDPEASLLTEEPGPELIETKTYPKIRITPALTANSDRLTVIRETRQDRAWVKPSGGAYAYGQSLHWYWTQLLYTYQELCELETIAPLIGLPVAARVPNPYTAGNQVALGVNDGTSRTQIDYSGLELLDGIPGAPSDPAHQIVVEGGNTTSGNSTWWSTISPSAYTINASTKVITLDSGVTYDIRARRVTRKDRLWVDIQTVGPIGWNSAVIGLLQKQMRFLREEACFVPQFFEGHPLNTPIFPRAWNWLVFTGGGGSFTFGGPYWGGDGSVVVYENDIELTEGTDYTVNWPEIVLNTPAGANDTITIGGTGGGGGFSFPAPDGDEGDSSPGTVTAPPPAPQVPIDFPGFDADLGFTLSISAVETTALSSGNWEGGTVVSVIQGNAPLDPLKPLYLKIAVTVTNPADLLYNRSGVLYFRGYCGSGDSLFAVACADDTTGDGNYDQVDTTSANLGCLDTTATTTQNLVRAKLAEFSRSNVNRPTVNFALGALGGMNDADIGGDVNNIPYMDAWVQLAEDSIAAQEAGVVSETGFTGEQFENYINPDVDFDDFDVPVP